MIVLTSPDSFEQRCHGRSIRGAPPDMKQGPLPQWIHENIATQLADIIRRPSQPMVSRDQPGVRPLGRRPPERRPPSITHPVRAKEDTTAVNQHRPHETRLARILFGTLPRFEGDNKDSQVGRQAAFRELPPGVVSSAVKIPILMSAPAAAADRPRCPGDGRAG